MFNGRTHILLFLLSALGPAGCSHNAPEHQVVVAEQDAVRIPLGNLADGGVHFFTYKHEGKNINFFVRTDGTGKLRTHFDACHSCFKYKLGYVWEKDRVICTACRVGYNLEDSVWDYVGACAPISLQSRVAGDFLLIARARLEKGKRLF